MILEDNRSIDWNMQDLIIPLARPIDVEVGDIVQLRFQYDAGGSLLALVESIDSNELT
jgi:hypothetical protein